MTILAARDVEIGRRLRLPAGVGDLKERRRRAVRKDDHSVFAPRAASSRRNVAKPLRGPTRRLDSLQARRCEKPERSAVGRPEGMKSVFRTRKWNRRQAVQGT